MELTLPQKLTISAGIVGAATSAFGALGPIMTSTETLIGTVTLGFVSACLAVVTTVLSSQTAQIKNVLSMDGVEPIKVNANANQALAQAAISADPAFAKIEPTPAAAGVVAATAKGT